MAELDLQQLQGTARRNLGQQDAQITSRNQQFTPVTPTPDWLARNTGPAATSTTNTQSFGVNRPAPTTDDLINNAIDQRRLQIAQHIDPDAPARFINPLRAKELRQEMSDLSNVRVQSAHFQLQQAHEQHEQDSVIKAGNDLAGMLGEVNSLQNSDVSPGTPQFEKALIGIYARHGEAARTQLGESIFRKYAAIHDGEVEKRQRISAYSNASNLAQKLGVNPVMDANGNPDFAATVQRAKDTHGEDAVNAVLFNFKKPSQPTDNSAAVAAVMGAGGNVTPSSISPTGGITYKVTPPESGKSFKEAYPGLTRGDVLAPKGAAVGDIGFDGKFAGNPNGSLIRVTDSKEQQHLMTIADYKKYGGKLSKTDETAQSGIPSFATEAEAEAAEKAGKLKKGDKVTVAGRGGTWQ